MNVGSEPCPIMPAKPEGPFSVADVIIVGSYVQDHVWQTDRFPQPGETRRARGFFTGPGGKGFNQAIACVRQQGNALFIGALGKDALADTARDVAAREGLDCEWLSHNHVPTAAAGIIVDARGANQIMVNLAANEHLTPAFLEAHSARFASARIVLVQLENNLDGIRSALELGRQHGLLRVLNPAPMRDDIDGDLLSACDVLTPNETEFAQLIEQFCARSLTAADVATMTDTALHALCRELGVATVVITLGASGCFVSHAEGTRRGDANACYRVAAEKVHAIDSTGAGDSFCGALVASLSKSMGRPFADAVRQAGRVAAMSTEKHGAALAIPTLEEVTARFRD
jgi:ribokinase